MAIFHAWIIKTPIFIYIWIHKHTCVYASCTLIWYHASVSLTPLYIQHHKFFFRWSVAKSFKRPLNHTFTTPECLDNLASIGGTKEPLLTFHYRPAWATHLLATWCPPLLAAFQTRRSERSQRSRTQHKHSLENKHLRYLRKNKTHKSYVMFSSYFLVSVYRFFFNVFIFCYVWFWCFKVLFGSSLLLQTWFYLFFS